MKVERMSWSKVNSISLCGQAFVYREIEKVPAPENISAIRGKSIHKPIELNMKNKLEHGELLPVDQVRENAAATVKAATQVDLMMDGDYMGLTAEQATGIVTDQVVGMAVHHATDPELAPAINPTAVEMKIEIAPSEALPVTWVGVIDLIDGDVIRDTKTKTKAPNKNLAHEGDQLSSYELLYRARYGKPSGGQAFDVLWQTPAKKENKHKTLRTDRSDADIATFVHRVNATRRMMEAEVFLPAASDSWKCTEKFCEYTTICPFFRRTDRPEN